MRGDSLPDAVSTTSEHVPVDPPGPSDAEVAAFALEAPPRDRRRTVLGALVSIIALGGCVWWATNQSAPRFPADAAHWSLLAVALLVYVAATLMRGWRWDVLLRSLDIRHKRLDAYALVTVGYMGNTVLPARGGELLRVFLLAERSDAKRREVLGSIIAERLLDVIALAGLFAIAAFAGLGGSNGGAGAWIAALGLIVLAIVGLGYLRLRVAGRLERFAGKVRPFTRSTRSLLTPMGAVLGIVSVALWCLEGLVFWLCTRALQIPVGFDEATVVVLLASLSGLIPAGPGYVGTYDAAALFALHRVGVRGGTAVGAVLLFRFVVFVPITLVGLVFMIARYGGVRGAMRREATARASS